MAMVSSRPFLVSIYHVRFYNYIAVNHVGGFSDLIDVLLYGFNHDGSVCVLAIMAIKN